MLNEPIHVLGAGSIGLLWTASIRSKFPTYPITLLLRDHDRNRNRVAAAAACGSSSGAGAHDSRDRDHRIDISWNNRHLAPVKYDSNEQTAASTPTPQQIISLPVQFINDSKHEQERIKTLIVATKAHQAKQAVESVLDQLLLPAVTDNNENNSDGDDYSNSDSASSSSSPTQIIVLCNGALSVRDELSKILPHTASTDNPISLALATTTHGAYLSEPHRLVHAGVGMTFLEQRQPMDNNNMVDLWNQAGLNCTSLPSQQMHSMMWNKLAANCVINPLTSIFRCTNGELLLEPSFPELKEDILKEVAGVAAGVAETNTIGGEDAKNSVVPMIDEMRKFVAQTIRDTRNNRSSMYQDIVMGHHQQTEIKHLNGYVVRKGKEMGKDCSANEELCSRIAELSVQNSSRNR
jgi:2-dehydropantoate 2-reductase